MNNYHTDHLNTPRVATGPAGTAVWRWDGGAFGETAPNNDPDGDGNLTTINLRYPGQYFDSETGLHYNWNRYYDPRIGRYISSDPIGLRGGLNTYLYARANPLRWKDPTGLLDNWEPGGGIGGDPIPWGLPSGPFGPVCGPEGSSLSTWIIPDAHGKANFTPVCEKHDQCYDCSGRPRKDCDDELCTSLKTACKVYGSRFGRQSCDRLANLYCSEVRKNGSRYYRGK